MNKIAIVIPYYKIDCFEATIQSLSLQSDKRFTLYIGNDASRNDPLPVIEKYFDSSEYFYYPYSDNVGGKNLELQWVRILENVQEEWFQILGDDDYLADNFVKTFYQNYTTINSYNSIKFKNILVDKDGEVYKSLYDDYTTGKYSVVDLFLKKIGGRLNSSLSEHIFRTATYKQIGFRDYDLAWHTDDMFVMEMCGFSDIYYIDESLVYIRTFDGSISGSKDNLDVKRLATQRFLFDFSKIIVEKKFNWNIKKEFLIRIRHYSNELGLDFIRRVYNQFGVIGKLYWYLYKFRLFFKSLLPKSILSKIQK